MEKVARTYRLSIEILNELQDIAKMLSISDTEAVSRAIHFYYLFLREEQDLIKQKAVVSLAEYQQLQNQLTQAIYKLGILEGENKEKDQMIQTLKDMYKDLHDKLIETQQNNKHNKQTWWKIFFWKT